LPISVFRDFNGGL